MKINEKRKSRVVKVEKLKTMFSTFQHFNVALEKGESTSDRLEAIMDLEHKAIERLKYASEISLAHYEKPLMITYSGGKDSDVLLELALKAEIPIEVIHNHTTADAPRTVKGMQYRVDRLKCLGNAVVPAQFYPIFAAIAGIERGSAP